MNFLNFEPTHDLGSSLFLTYLPPLARNFGNFRVLDSDNFRAFDSAQNSYSSRVTDSIQNSDSFEVAN